MEYLEGVDVQRLVERFGPQPPARVVHILLQVCESLAEAHEASLVHRDVKPSNILLSRLASASDFVKVLDFGLARPSRARATDDVTSGTPAYMAPEVAMGDDEVDDRSDIYSLGCVAYWLLTGSPVFESEDPAEVLANHVNEEPVPASSRSEFDIPADLDRIVSRCLAKDPDDRFASVRAVAEALEECDLEDAWSSEDAEEWWELHFPETGVPEDLAGMLR